MDGKLTSVNVFHHEVEILRADGLTAVVKVPADVARRVAQSFHKATETRQTLTVRVIDAVQVADSVDRVADPTIVRSLCGTGLYDLLDEIHQGKRSDDIEPVREMLSWHGFKLHRSKRGRYSIIVTDETTRRYTASNVLYRRKRLPNERGVMPLHGSSGQSAASWMWANSPLD